MTRPRIGLALGSGSARGWAHIGIIRALLEQGVVPDVVTGTSMGALVGAAHVSGDLDRLEAWVTALRWTDMVALMDVGFSRGGLIGGERLMRWLAEGIEDSRIEHCEVVYGAVATDLARGDEVWLRSGSILEAVHASIALPGLFSPVMHEGRWLVDGGLVNPVPVSLCRALGAERVIAVDLGTDLMDRHPLPGRGREPVAGPEIAESPLSRQLTNVLGVLRLRNNNNHGAPSMLDVMARSINVMSARISRSRMAGDPPDMLLTPRLARIGLLEFHRAAEAIEEGMREVKRSAGQLARLEL
jgi:NTE family protein